MATVEVKFTKRTIRFQFRRGGLNHLTEVKDYHPSPSGWDYTTYPVITHCGLNIPLGAGGWGYGPKDCPKCLPKEMK